MLMLVSYDVNTTNAAGRKRLRHIAKICEDWGIRVQNSVFECYVDWTQWIALKSQLEEICDPEVDSLRYYNLGNKYEGKAIHYGAKETVDPSKDVIVI
jgi:CRISPR-associated protein Cas2